MLYLTNPGLKSRQNLFRTAHKILESYLPPIQAMLSTGLQDWYRWKDQSSEGHVDSTVTVELRVDKKNLLTEQLLSGRNVQ